MELREYVPMSELTTFKVGGPARYVALCDTEQDVQEACAFAQDHGLPMVVIGEGSNVLPKDSGFTGLVVRPRIMGIAYSFEQGDVRVTAGAGVLWDDLVDDTVSRGLWGFENLAGIPGTVGATPVQNVGAYGAEIVQTFESARVFNALSKEITVVNARDAQFGYRDSIFKHRPELIILEVTYLLASRGVPKIGYADLSRLAESGVVLDTPLQIAQAVREVRSHKFPDLRVFGTAGSFFKNPLLTRVQFEELSRAYGAVPSFPAGAYVKVPLAFILDRVLGLRGYKEGHVSLFGNQPLVVVAEHGATAHDVDVFAKKIADRVEEKTGIIIEREVRSF